MGAKWIIVGIDTGGTFTDSIAISDHEMRVLKIPSTPSNPLSAVVKSMETLGSSIEVIHGTTVATNAILERKGAKVALITTAGFEDIIEIGRQNRDDIYSLYPSRPDPLVKKELRFGVLERITSTGDIETPLEKEELAKLLEGLHNKDFDSIAICTLFSFLNPIHEYVLSNAVSSLGPVSVSSKVLPEYREYERMSTVVMDAYVKPLMKKYLANLEKELLEKSLTNIFAVMKSSKGLARGKTISEYPVHTLFSGLAGGIQAAELTSRLLDQPNILSLDIGGTSCDVAAITNYENSLLQTLKISGLPILTPTVDVETIGAGGGSIIEFKSGLIKVGPESAGAKPGPVAYDQGGILPTTTDADLAYGVLSVFLAGGELTMNRDLAVSAMKSFSELIETPYEETISGVRKVFHENIASALRLVSTQRGLDPREYNLLAFGGAGPLHACEIAELININSVIIPPHPGAWSAMGLIGGDYIYNSSRGKVILLDNIAEQEIEKLYTELEQEVTDLAIRDEIKISNSKMIKSMALRFKGQSFDLNVEYSDSLGKIKNEFINLHEKVYGFAAKNEPIELVALRAKLTIPHEDPVLPILKSKNVPEIKEERKVLGIKNKVPVYLKNDLGVNTEIYGPVIIDQLDTTTWLPPNWKLSVNKHGFMLLTLK